MPSSVESPMALKGGRAAAAGDAGAATKANGTASSASESATTRRFMRSLRHVEPHDRVNVPEVVPPETPAPAP